MSLVRAATDIISDIISRINELNTDIRPTNYSIARITAIDPQSQQMADLWYLLDYLQKSQSISGFRNVISNNSYILGLVSALGYNSSTGTRYNQKQVLNMIESDIKEYAKNFLIYQKPAVPAHGLILLINNTGSPITAPLGSIVGTKKGTTFKTSIDISAVTPVFMATYPSSSLVAGTTTVGAYAIAVPIAAVNNGVSGNVPAETILTFSGMTNVSRVSNPEDTTGGKEKESVDALLNRLSVAWQGRNLPTRGGYTTYITNQTDVDDALVVMPGDDLAIREGATDIYVQGRVQGAATDVFKYVSPKIYLTKQPVINVLSIVGSSTYVKDTDFKFVKDTEAYAESVSGRDYVEFFSGHEPAAGEALSIYYIYDALATRIQTNLDTEDNREVAGNVLIKMAKRKLVNITAEIAYMPGYTVSTVKSDITSNIQLFFSGTTAGDEGPKLLGDGVNQSDVIAVIEGTDGVDYVEVPLLAFYAEYENAAAPVTATSDNTITPAENEYLVVGTITYIDL